MLHIYTAVLFIPRGNITDHFPSSPVHAKAVLLACPCLFLTSPAEVAAFLLSTSPEPSHKRTLSTLQRKPPHIKLIPLLQAYTEQHQVNSLWVFLPKTWILNLICPVDLTTITQ
ncbi:hypothetical protein ILYODFUR_035155 [Ilyodon furcidens]|uniref:Uncharacterized protein n=1 Tax=Ilyodon furcidens TaxID=33524 RepID=A0ABV0VK38_9TELE